jgi:hypothetical protein
VFGHGAAATLNARLNRELYTRIRKLEGTPVTYEIFHFTEARTLEETKCIPDTIAEALRGGGLVHHFTNLVISRNDGVRLRSILALEEMLPRNSHLTQPTLPAPEELTVGAWLRWEKSSYNTQTSEVLTAVVSRGHKDGRLNLKLQSNEGFRRYQCAHNDKFLEALNAVQGPFRVQRKVSFGRYGEVTGVKEHLVVPA